MVDREWIRTTSDLLILQRTEQYAEPSKAHPIHLLLGPAIESRTRRGTRSERANCTKFVLATAGLNLKINKGL